MIAQHDHKQIRGLKWVKQEMEGNICHKSDILIEKSENPIKRFFEKK